MSTYQWQFGHLLIQYRVVLHLCLLWATSEYCLFDYLSLEHMAGSIFETLEPQTVHISNSDQSLHLLQIQQIESLWMKNYKRRKLLIYQTIRLEFYHQWTVSALDFQHFLIHSFSLALVLLMTFLRLESNFAYVNVKCWCWVYVLKFEQTAETNLNNNVFLCFH